jgi:excisionase family DNA binding protein
MTSRAVETEALLTPAEVAQLFRVDPKTVTRWAKAGKITSLRTLGGHRRYRESEVRNLLGEAESASWRAGAFCRVLNALTVGEQTSGAGMTSSTIRLALRPLPGMRRRTPRGSELVRASLAASTAAKYGKYTNEDEPAHRRGSPSLRSASLVAIGLAFE